MTGARYVFAVRRVGAGAGAAPSWRLVGGNSRGVGRAPGVFDSVESGVAAVSSLRDRLADAGPAVTVGRCGSGWSWQPMPLTLVRSEACLPGSLA